MRRALPAILALLALNAALSAGARAAPGAIQVITVQQAITPATTSFLRSALEAAAKEQAEMLIVQLDTPGGLLDATKDIVQLVLGSSIPVVVYISPAGARAASAGTMITLASHVAAMAPATHIGAAHPVSLFGTGNQDKVVGEKIVNDTAAFIESIAELRGRNVEWAISAVRESKSITANKALELKVVELLAEDLPDLIRQLEGRTVRLTKDRTVTLRTQGRPVVQQGMTVSQGFLSLVSNPNLVFLLLIIGLVALYIEFSNPGLIAPGVIGAISLLTALIALQTLPVRYGALGLMLLGAALLVAEAFVPSFGILGIGGIASIVIGSLFLLDETATDLVVDRVLIGVTVGTLAVISLFIGRLLLKSFRVPPRSSQSNLVGQLAVAREDLAADKPGHVLLNGEIWKARSTEPVPAGSRVVVRAVHGLLLDVALELPAAQPPPAERQASRTPA
jgi:membrane-bound serine protease (ClpP class)